MPDNFMSALQLAIIDMVVVFAVLAGLIVVIQATKALLTRANGKPKGPDENGEDEGRHEIVDLVSQTSPGYGAEGDETRLAEPLAARTPAHEAGMAASAVVEPAEPQGLTGGVVAAISAALAAYMGPDVPVRIKSITPVPGAVMDAWLVAGRGRLMRTGLGPRQRRSKSWRNVSE